MRQFLLSCVIAMVSCGAFAADYTVQGSWDDPTATGPEYVAQYHAECQVDYVPVYQDLVLAFPGFSTVLTFDPASTFQCRVRAVNIVVPSVPVEGPWSLWIDGVAATTPSAPGQIILIQIAP